MKPVAFCLLAALAAGSGTPLWAQGEGLEARGFAVADVSSPAAPVKTEGKLVTILKIGSYWPFGKELSEYFGTRYPIGIETRARSESGIGGSVSVDVWWQSHENRTSTFVPVSIGTSYGRKLLEGAVVPFAGLFVSYTFAQLYFDAGPDLVRATGSGLGGGLVVGAEVPIVEGFNTLAELKLSLGGIPMVFDSAVGAIGEGRHTVATSGFGLNFGVSMGFSEPCLW